VFGDGPIDIVYVPQVSHTDVETWDTGGTGLLGRLARFARVIAFDKRGTGLSGRVLDLPTFEQQMDDVLAVVDAAQSTQPAIVGVFDGATLAALFAATYPHRTRALVTWALTPRTLRAPDYPWGVDPLVYECWISEAREGMGMRDLRELLDPSTIDNEETQRA